MTTFSVIAWNEYSTKPENSRKVITHEVEAENVSGALDQAQVMAANWNREETRENMKVNLLTCNGFIRNA